MILYLCSCSSSLGGGFIFLYFVLAQSIIIKGWFYEKVVFLDSYLASGGFDMPA